jgi:hypothetical protein
VLRWAWLKRVVAGAIFGMYMAHLLYFLNPQVDITPGRLVAVTLVYGFICGLLFGSALWGFRVLRVKLIERIPDTSARARGFGYIVLAAFIATAIYWIHLAVLRIYLPIGAVRILSKATNVITATAFVLLVLWIVERSADTRLSRSIVGTALVLIALSSFFLYQRRESYRTEKKNVVVANIGTVAGKRPLIFITIRNLPYDWIVTMNGEGVMPWFDRATRQSFFTRLEPFPTTSSRALWASLATGKLPYRHGVTGRFSYRTALSGPDPAERFLLLPSGVGFRTWGLVPPVERISAQLPSGDALPVWSLFARVGLTANVISWPATKSVANVQNNAGLTARITRGGPARLVEDMSVDGAALTAAQNTGDTDITVVAVERFAETQRALDVWTNDLPSRDSPAGEVIRNYAHYLDQLIGQIAAANPDHLIVVSSPTAVAAPSLPATPWSFLMQGIRNSDPGADDGFFLITGPGVTNRPNPAPVLLEDVVPTILFAAGLPVGRDMDGRILSEAFVDDFLRRTVLSAIQTYEAEQLVVRRRGA